MNSKPLQYSDLTYEQTTFFLTYVYNNVRLREFPIDIAQFTFEEQNRIHDFEYWRGGTEKDRRRADRKFLAGCLSTTLKRIMVRYWIPFCVGIIGYWIVIRAFGRFSFYYADTPASTWKEFVDRCECLTEKC